MKTVTLSISSSNEDLLKTMLVEGKAMEYWHKKYYGGSHKYDKWQSEQLVKVQKLPVGGELIGEMVDYHSHTSGNRWKSFEVTTNYGEGNSYTRMFKFCYWDTYGSVGAFYNCMSSDRKHHQLLVFPSHFFLRYADRMGIKHRDAALVCEFFNRNHVFAMKISNEPNTDGTKQIIIGAKEGACYGIARTKVETLEDLGRDNVFEVRTFLRYEQMSNKQKKESKQVRELAEMCRLADDAPSIHAVGRAITDEEYANDILKHYGNTIGVSLEQMQQIQLYMYQIMETTDFVSGDIRNSIDALSKGKVDSNAHQKSFSLIKILAKHIKEDASFLENMMWRDVLHIVHEWKGEKYDWNKWFWGLCYMFKQNAETAKSKEKLEQIMEKCMKCSYTYDMIDKLFNDIIYEKEDVQK